MATKREKHQILEDVLYVCAVLRGEVQFRGGEQTATLPKNEVEMMLLTIAAESSFEHRRQIGGGPARGLMQMETATALDTFRWMDYRTALRKEEAWKRLTLIWLGLETVNFFTPTAKEIDLHLERRDYFALALGRQHYRMFEEPFPKLRSDQAAYWKKYWNTPAGAQTVDHAIRQWKACRCDRLMKEAARLCNLV